jgi:hypothetical protein
VELWRIIIRRQIASYWLALTSALRSIVGCCNLVEGF